MLNQGSVTVNDKHLKIKTAKHKFRTFGRTENNSDMKTMTCKQLGGACDQNFSAKTFDEIAMMVSKHAREMVQQGDAAHLEAMNEMRNKMTTQEAMNAWMDEKRNAFNALPNDNR